MTTRSFRCRVRGARAATSMLAGLATMACLACAACGPNDGGPNDGKPGDGTADAGHVVDAGQDAGPTPGQPQPDAGREPGPDTAPALGPVFVPGDAPIQGIDLEATRLTRTPWGSEATGGMPRAVVEGKLLPTSEISEIVAVERDGTGDTAAFHELGRVRLGSAGGDSSSFGVELMRPSVANVFLVPIAQDASRGTPMRVQQGRWIATLESRSPHQLRARPNAPGAPGDANGLGEPITGAALQSPADAGPVVNAAPDWVRVVGAGPVPLPPGTTHAMAYDSRRARMVRFGGDTDSLGGQGSAPGGNDTWELVQGEWTLRHPVHRPQRRKWPGMAFDEARGVVLLFGGRGEFTTELADTWEWDGRDWRELHPKTVPPGRISHAMAYDPDRGVVVLTGGARSGPDTWEWDGKDFQPRTGTHWSECPARLAMAYDRVRKQMVLPCAQPDTGDGKAGTDTWVLGPDGWTLAASELVSQGGMPPHASQGVTFDEGRGRVVLHGGFDASPFDSKNQADTWEWDGSTWQHVATTPAIAGPSVLTYDGSQGRVLWTGIPSDRTLGASWTWDGATWRALHDEATIDSAPGARFDYALAYDDARRKLVLFGGDQKDDTWEFDGQRWSQQSPESAPSPRSRHGMAHDAGRKRVVLFGGKDAASGSVMGDTWQWDGQTWTAMNPTTKPPARELGRMVYDGERIVLLGGSDDFRVRRDMWFWDGSDWTRGPALPATEQADAWEVAASYDSRARQLMLLIGDAGAVPATHAWDGNTWTTLDTTKALDYLVGTAFAYDPRRNATVALGARRQASDRWGPSLTRVWEGSEWRDPGFVTIDGFSGRQLVYDSARGRIVAFGDMGDMAELPSDGTGAQPAFVMRFDTTAEAGIPDDATWDRQRVRVLARGTGGAQLLASTGMRWQVTAAHDRTDPSPLVFELSDSAAIYDRLDRGGILLMLRSKAEASDPPGRVQLDYAEITVDYHLPAPAQ